jgi:hypothetical protein
MLQASPPPDQSALEQERLHLVFPLVDDQVIATVDRNKISPCKHLKHCLVLVKVLIGMSR